MFSERRSILLAADCIYLCFRSRSCWCNEVKQPLSCLSPRLVNRICFFVCGCCLCWSHTNLLAGRAPENLERREERQKVCFFFFKKQKNIRKIKIFSMSPASSSGTTTLDAFTPLMPSWSLIFFFFNISGGTGP